MNNNDSILYNGYYFEIGKEVIICENQFKQCQPLPEPILHKGVMAIIKTIENNETGYAPVFGIEFNNDIYWVSRRDIKLK